MPHHPESLTNLIPVVRDEQCPSSRNRNRMVVERTEIRQSGDNVISDGDSNGGYMQVEISMAVETMLDDSVNPYNRKSMKTQCEPGLINDQLDRKELHRNYQENQNGYQRGYIGDRQKDSDDWISPSIGERLGYRFSDSYRSIPNNDEKRLSESTFMNELRTLSIEYDNRNNDNNNIDRKIRNVDNIGVDDDAESSNKSDSIWSKSGSLREFLTDYENIINGGNQALQTNERIGESGYRSESTAYEETVSTIHYSDSATPEYRYVNNRNTHTEN
uniref:Uncharacterized protein n=1 Tax=Setaria digitata TaxID=48799 RepID=A0A915Q029_9BILA